MSTPSSTPVPAPSPGATPLRVGDAVVVGGAVIALIGSFLGWVGEGDRSLDLWDSLPSPLLLPVLLAVAVGVVEPLLGARPAPERTPRLGLTWAGGCLAAAAFALLEVLCLDYSVRDSLKVPGPLITTLGILVVAAGTAALLLLPDTHPLRRRLVGGVGGRPGAPTAAPPTPGYAGQAPAAPAPAPASGPGWEPPTAAYTMPSALSEPPVPAPAAAPAPVSYQPPPMAAPVWAGVLSPIAVYDPAAPGTQVAQIGPGRWYQVVGQISAGVLVDLDGRTALVRDTGALIRG